MPDTDNARAVGPVITIVLEIPLTVTTLSFGRRSSLFSPDAGHVERRGLAAATGQASMGRKLGVGLVDGPRGGAWIVRGEKSSTGVVVTPEELMIDRTPESWCAAKAAMPPARASTPMTMIVPRIPPQCGCPEGGLGCGSGVRAAVAVHGPVAVVALRPGGRRRVAMTALRSVSHFGRARAASASGRSRSRIRFSGSSLRFHGQMLPLHGV